MARGLFRNRDNKGYLFILPYFLAMLTFQVYPIFYTLFLSFFKPVNLVKNEFIGFGNYVRLLQNPLFYTAIGNTWVYLVDELHPPDHLCPAAGGYSDKLPHQGTGTFQDSLFPA